MASPTCRSNRIVSQANLSCKLGRKGRSVFIDDPRRSCTSARGENVVERPEECEDTERLGWVLVL